MVTQKTGPQLIIRMLIFHKVLGSTKDISQAQQAQQSDLIGPSCCSRDRCNHHYQRLKKSAAGAQMTAICPMTVLKLGCCKDYAKIEGSSGIEFPKPHVAGRERNRSNVAADSATKIYKRAV
jgi:hypothetical protein